MNDEAVYRTAPATPGLLIINDRSDPCRQEKILILRMVSIVSLKEAFGLKDEPHHKNTAGSSQNFST